MMKTCKHDVRQHLLSKITTYLAEERTVKATHLKTLKVLFGFLHILMPFGDFLVFFQHPQQFILKFRPIFAVEICDVLLFQANGVLEIKTSKKND